MDFSKSAKDLVSKMTVEEKISQITHIAKSIDRLGIPAFNWWAECIHGSCWSGDATAFPQTIAMAASFDKELIGRVGSAIGDEIRAKYNEFKEIDGNTYSFEGLVMCSPNINIFRDPRWGRGQETYGEDPYLTGAMASSYINGLQGDGKYLKTAATLKHYAVHSGPEGKRHEFSADVSEKDLYETYLSAFKYCIEHSDIKVVMTAYNAINGVPCCINEHMIKDVLRKEFKFGGLVDIDLNSVEDLPTGFKVCENKKQAAAMALNAGCDVDVGDSYREYMLEAYNEGLVNEERITEACERAMELRYALGMFDNKCDYDNIPYDVVRCDKHMEINRQMASDSIVLLKNDGILPLKGDSKMAVIGPNSNDVEVMLGSYSAKISGGVTVFEGIKEVSPSEVYWAYGTRRDDESEYYWRENYYRSAVAAAKRADIVVMVMGLSPELEGEEGAASEWSVNGDKPSINLPMAQKILFERIYKLGKPIIFINMSGSCVNLCEQNEKCNAVIQSFYPGELGGRAIADVLFGRVNPSGRLPVTFYASDNDLPPIEDYSMKNRTYKYFKGKPLYPFGYGMSYTTFEYGNITRKENSVNLEIKNTGNYDGANSILLYGKDDVYKLIGFEKVFLKQGESKTVEIKYEGKYDSLKIGENIFI